MASDILLGPPVMAGKPLFDNPETDEATVISLIYQSMNMNLEDGKPPMGLTENLSPTFLSTSNTCLDFFFHVVPNTPSDLLIPRLEVSWTHDPLTTLKLICNLRGPARDSVSVVRGFEKRKMIKQEWIDKTRRKLLVSANAKRLKRVAKWRAAHPVEEEEEENVEKKQEEESVENVKESKPVITKEEARVLRKAREAVQARKALEKYKSDSNYRLFYDSVCDVFADVLKSDMEFLKANELSKISLAAKWCPSIDSSYDKASLICEGIARRIFPRESDKEYEKLEEAHYVYRVRDRLRKQVLVPLHKALQLPEVFMSANEWNALPYGRVPSVAMKNYKNLFEKHDKERFEADLEKVKSREAKIAAGALLPHEIVKSANEDSLGEVAELQWKRMVEDVSKKGKLKNCMAVCDVSGSMSGIPMEVCVALGILVSELSEEPWKGKVITFSENPQLHLVEGDSLKAKSEFVEAMDWGTNTDFQKVFDKILEVAAENNLSEDQLIKRLYVFSDMEFDDCADVRNRRMFVESVEKQSKKGWETDYEVIKRKFKEHGYSKVPEIVFWNLRDSNSTPVVAKQSGVAMVSGFSKNLLTLFLDEGGIVNAEDVMGLALAGTTYTFTNSILWTMVSPSDQKATIIDSGKVPGLAVVIVGNRKYSQSYVNMKRKACAEVGIKSFDIDLLEQVSEAHLISKVLELNAMTDVHGILVQLPLPKHINEVKVLTEISLEKDVDGFHPLNIGKLAMKGREPLFLPCTPKGCLELPSRNATVTVVHSHSPDPESVIREADIIIAAAGQPMMIKDSWIKPGAAVIDVGTNAVEDRIKKTGFRLVGDVHFKEACKIAGWITPVPGGVGPMTVAMLLKNTLDGVKRVIEL
ncbi:hypothetical protein QYF36_019595 [Acer negundo]|nr:hypothetical protein QYF36_019595 [Acer negundo]